MNTFSHQLQLSFALTNYGYFDLHIFIGYNRIDIFVIKHMLISLNTTNFVDHSVDDNGVMYNAESFSHEFVKLIMLASSKFEVIGKELCMNSGISINKNDNILVISKQI